MTKFDAIIIGAGHNGLTAAAYLAKAGNLWSCSIAEINPAGAPAQKPLAPDLPCPTAPNG
jgi:glycine/D-amino acid oxidase-like deaminating enzyme